MSGLLFDKPLAVVDVETTGSSPGRCRVLEIAIIRVEQGKIVETLNTVLDPECSIPVSITSLTGIREEDITSAPTFNDKVEEIEKLLSGAIFVAHNAQFDYAFIKSEFKRLGKKFTAKRLCTVSLSRKLFPKFKRHDLSSIISRYDFECEDRHRALADAKVLIDFLEHACELAGEEKYKEITDSILSRNSVPAAIPIEIIDALPESSGVYIFYGESGEKLYIGKSVNIKKRVLSHFTCHGTNKSVKLAHEIRDIEALATHGELGALLLESELIKQEQPLYNRMLRHARKLIVAKEYLDEKKYKRVKLREYLVHADKNKTEEEYEQEVFTGENYRKVLGVFKSLSQAKKTLQQYAEEHELCQVLLGLEKTKTCFGSQIGKCSGACSGKELPELYNAKFDIVFKKRRIKNWPFSGPVLIEEKGSESNTGTVFIVDDWKLLESFTYDEYENKREFLKSKHFDYDCYKILANYIVKNPKKIKLFNQKSPRQHKPKFAIVESWQQ